MKMNSRLVPKGLEPKKSKPYQKLKNSRTSARSTSKHGPDSALVANQNYSIEVMDSMKDMVVRGSLESQDLIAGN